MTDPAIEATRLMSNDPEQALNRLKSWWATNQPEALALAVDSVGHVECYKVDKQIIYVIFAEPPGIREGHICLVGSNGRLIPIFQGHNYLSDEDQFVDLNGDGVPEILTVHGVGGTSPDNPSKIVTTTTSIVIIPISHHQQPLLHVLFGKRNLREPSTWHWNLRILEDGRSVITLSSPTSTAPIAEFEWQAAIGAFSCPQGSPSEGFIARAGSIPSQLIEEFVRPDLGGNKEASTDASEFRQLIEKSMNHLQTLTASHDGLWNISEASWAVDLDDGIITFDSPNGMHVEAPVQIIGTYNTNDGTWLWGWDHPSVGPPLDQHSQQMLEYGSKHGISDLTSRKVQCTVERCWEFAAVACLLANAQGVYRGPSGSTLIFMTFGEVKLSKSK